MGYLTGKQVIFPPLTKGENLLESFQNHPPLIKGERGGFCCAVVFPKITSAYSLCEHSLTIPPAQQVHFETINPAQIIHELVSRYLGIFIAVLRIGKPLTKKYLRNDLRR